MPTKGPRLDQAVVAAGLAESRERARALILAGRVYVDGERRDKPGHAIGPQARVELSPGRKLFVSRGGDKLDSVLDPLNVDLEGARCLDVGASTGGFTDVMLRRGARHVTCVDVGKGLLDASLVADPRVTNVEKLNARYLRPDQVDPPYDLCTIDVSFISLRHVLPAVLPLMAASGRVLALVKPQFEVGRAAVGRKGVVHDPADRAGAVLGIAHFLLGQNWRILGVRASGVAGPKGNREVFLLAGHDGLDPESPPGDARDDQQLATRIERECAREIG